MISVDGQVIKPTMFPDGTSQVWKLCEETFRARYSQVTWHFEHESEFMHLAQVKKLLDQGTTVTGVCLRLDYLPYARQDKLVSNNSTFALRSFADLLNSLNFLRIDCFDPHSDIAENIIARFHPIWPLREVRHAVQECQPDLVCYPDSGAYRKYSTVLSGLELPPVVVGSKVRNPVTGAITGYELGYVPARRRALIVDDICDGGATFVRVAEALRQRGVTSIDLYVSHGIFSRGIDVLKAAGISRIFTREGEII